MTAALQADERALAVRLRAASSRHEAEAEVHHLALDLADWSDAHADELDPWVGAGADHHAAPTETSPPDPALALLWDLRAIHRHALDVALCWELVTASAMALHDQALAGIARRCHDESVRQAAWAAALAKQGAPQVLGS
jgi:hypothetical protein